MNITTLFSGSVGMSTIVFSNTLQSYAIALGIFIGLSLVFRFIQWGVLKRLENLSKKTETDVDDTLIEVVRSLKPAFYYLVALYFALQWLSFSTLASRIIDGVILLVVAYQVVTALHILVDYVFRKKAERDGGDTEKAFQFLSTFIKWILWLIAIIAVLSNLGIDVTSLIAGLGIGGIAVALALQNILSDLFSSFAIYLDKPFEVGDFIIVGNNSGTVERIGIKTTRLRALQGEEIVISNKELTSARVQNMKKMEERRATFTFGVVYETKPDVLEKIPALVREIFKSVGESRARLDRVHLAKLNDSSVDFDVVYYVPTSDYAAFMDTQQEILLKLFAQFGKEKIDFAYPTQTVFVAK